MELFIGNQLQVCYDSWLSTIYNFLMFVHFYYVWPYFISSSKNPLINHLNFYCTRNTCTQQPLARLPNLFSVTLVKIPHVFTRVILCEFVWTYVITCDRLCEDMILATWDRLLGALWDRFRFRNIVLSFLSSSPPLSMVSKPTVYKYWLRFKNTLKLVIGYPASFFNRLLGVWYRSKEHFLANWQSDSGFAWLNSSDCILSYDALHVFVRLYIFSYDLKFSSPFLCSLSRFVIQTK